MSTLLRSKWLFVVILLFAAVGVLATLSLLPTRITSSPEASAPVHAQAEFVSTAYADTPPDNDDLAVLESVNRALRAVVINARESVVRIEATAKAKRVPARGERSSPHNFPFPFEWPFGPPQGEDGPEVWTPPRHGLGSGIIIGPDGYILTNNHVVEGADELTVKLNDGREFDAKLVGRDPRTDLAVVKVDANGLTPMPIGDSDELDVGEFVIAIGAPFGLSRSASFGIVSAKGRSAILERMNPEMAPYEDFIQTDAAINPGNSGGPLLNIHGELVGVNTAISSQTGQNAGVGFAISSNLARKIMKDLIEKGKVVRAWLGVYISDVDDAVAERLGLDRPRGALVRRVQDDSPASKAGLKPLDVIIAEDGQEVPNSNYLRNRISTSPVGQTVRLTILRNGKKKEIRVKLGELQENQALASAGPATEAEGGWTGLTVRQMQPDEAKELGYEDLEGVLVTDVKRGSPAGREGIPKGALILEIDGKAIQTVDDFEKAIKSAGDSVFVKWRQGPTYGLSVLKKPE